MSDIKHFCKGPNCSSEIAEPTLCCSGFECGCQGLPVEPPFCSSECYENYMIGSDPMQKEAGEHE